MIQSFTFLLIGALFPVGLWCVLRPPLREAGITLHLYLRRKGLCETIDRQ
jgi:hypothetical protein